MTALVMGLPGGMEWVILLVVALLLFGGSRVAGMGKGAGRAIREFKEEVKAPTGIEAQKTAEPEDLAKPVDAEIVTTEPRKEA
jgi:sec-independent protein translocase protein TatA